MGEHPYRRQSDDLILHIDSKIDSLRGELMAKLDKVDDKTQEHDRKLRNGITERLDRLDSDFQTQNEKIDTLMKQMGATVTYKTLIGIAAGAAAIASAMFAVLSFIVRIL